MYGRQMAETEEYKKNKEALIKWVPEVKWKGSMLGKQEKKISLVIKERQIKAKLICHFHSLNWQR